MFTNGLLQLLLKIFNIEKNHEKYIPTRTNIYNDNKTTFNIGAELTRSTSTYALPLFLPALKIQGKNNLSKVCFWEQLSDKPRNSFPRPVLTYHFLVQIGALEHSSSFRVWLRSKICPKNFLAVKKTYNLKVGWHASSFSWPDSYYVYCIWTTP